ncbi:MAG TPA: alkaline phosphatase family protein [Thermoanaerobaculia bacterium]|nr:alkaline phosphatase family protein [Thermoanaerobaculia bacterium]
MRRSLSLLLLVLLSCVSAPPPAVAPPQPPQLAATSTARRVVLLSFDGLGADALARQQGLSAFERLSREGAWARIINVDPTLTAPTHVAILTGAVPQRTGIVSNRFHLAGRPIDETARGMMQDPDVESLVEAARRQGKRVGAVSFPTIDNKTERRTADFGLVWAPPLVPSRIVNLKRADFKREWVPPTWTDRPQRRRSYSPIQRARVEWGFRLDVFVVAYDTTDDSQANYDAYFVEAGEREIAPDARGWFAVSAESTAGLRGSWSKLLRTSPALDVTIYWGPISRNESWPDSFRDLLNREAGFWPGAPEEELAVDTDTFIEQLDRLADFYTRAQMISIERMPFDLLLAYHSGIDIAAHRYLGTPESDRVQRAAFVAADRTVAAFAEALQADDALIVTGDHGLVVADREVRLNTLLAERGFAPRWHAYSSGAYAHLYRFSDPDDSDAVMTMLDATGLFERIEKKSATSHRNSGDLIAWGHPNVAVVPEELSPAIVDPAPPHGQHGGLNIHRELHPPLFAIGQGVPVGAFGEFAQTKIARFVAGLMGIAPPAAAE